MTTWAHYRRAIDGEPLPCAFVDLDQVDRNIDTLLAPVRAAGKTLRVASKSLRCAALLRHIEARGEGVVQGVMAFSSKEAAWLASEGFHDIFVAYPTAQPSDAQALARANQGEATVGIVVDDPAHLDLLEAAAREAGVVVPVVVEVDVSYRPAGDLLHIGSRRSPLRTAEATLSLCEEVDRRPHVRLMGVMGYEGHIAGLQDDNPFSNRAMNHTLRWIKRKAVPACAELRERIAAGLTSRGIAYDLFNGGGTGSVETTSAESAVTEATAGSGFVDSHLFDYYAHLTLQPAIGFALQVVRRPDKRHVTCHGGGYIASGAAGPDRMPLPWLPEGVKYVSMEGAGEVQTPLVVPKSLRLELGDPVFFRHAKAGELAEHFNEYLLLRGQEIVERVPTYRGAGHCFLG